MVESQPSKLLVAGSIPVSRSSKSAAGSRQPAVERARSMGFEAPRRPLRSIAERPLSAARRPLPATRADVAQLAERVLGKDEVSSSILDIGSILRPSTRAPRSSAQAGGGWQANRVERTTQVISERAHIHG